MIQYDQALMREIEQILDMKVGSQKKREYPRLSQLYHDLKYKEKIDE